MKVSIKGLVFTGFAAAILSANAMAANPASDINTVTSKSYVDAKIVQTTNGTATDKAPSENAVKTALATKQPIQDTANYKVGQSGDWQPLNSAVAVSGYLAKTDETNGSVTLNIDTANQLTTSYTDGTPLNSSSTKLVTEGVVAQAIADAADIDNFVVDSIVDSVTDKAPSQNAVYDALADKQDASTAVTHTQDSAVGSATVPVYIDSTGAAQPTTLGTAATANVSTGIADADAGLTTGDQVHDYVAAQLADTSLVGNGGFTVNINGTEQTFYANQSGDTSIEVTGLEVTSNKTDDVATNSADSTTYPSTKGVYDYVQSVTGGTTIPARNPSVCTDSTPCALVYEADGAHWRTMATATDSGGVLGDAQ